MKTIFITGASAGLGKATAKLFQTNGWKVIATMRSPKKEQELSKLPNVTLLPLDVTNVDQINATVKHALSLGDIHVVFNNAGYSLVGPLEACTDDQIASQINTNLMGVLRVTKAFIPYFREKQDGLFITTTSVCGFSSNPLSCVYNATKWALEGWAESISYDLAQFNIRIKSVAPGGIKSNFSHVMDVASDPAYDDLFKKLNTLFNDGSLIEFTEPEAIAEVVYEAATDGKDQLRYQAGNDAVRIYHDRQQNGTEAFRIGLTRRLFPERLH